MNPYWLYWLLRKLIKYGKWLTAVQLILIIDFVFRIFCPNYYEIWKNNIRTKSKNVIISFLEKTKNKISNKKAVELIVKIIELLINGDNSDLGASSALVPILK